MITVSDHIEERVPLITIVAQEHDHLTSMEVQSDYNKDTDAGNDDDEAVGNDDDILVVIFRV